MQVRVCWLGHWECHNFQNLSSHHPSAFASISDLTHWNRSAVDLVCISSKVSQCLYGSLEVHKQGGQKRFPTVQWLNSLKRDRGDVWEICDITLWSSHNSILFQCLHTPMGETWNYDNTKLQIHPLSYMFSLRQSKFICIFKCRGNSKCFVGDIKSIKWQGKPK